MLSVAKLNSLYVIDPTLPAVPAAIAAEPEAPWKLKNVEMLLGVPLANVVFCDFGQIRVSGFVAFAPFRKRVKFSDVPEESVRYQTVICCLGKSILIVFVL